jgi:branched-chain amino acid transport system ATP-binding protein
MSGDPILEIKNLCLAFQGVTAFSDVSFAVADREICSLVGPNGAGKSSLLNVISGLYRPTSGTVSFKGYSQPSVTPRWAAAHGIARTFQNIALFKHMTALENVLTGRSLSVKSTLLEQAFNIGRARGEAKAERERARDMLELLGIGEHAQTPVGKLPYGMQKRVEFGRALASTPQLLLLDEPLAGMNFEEKQAMARLIVDVNERFGTSVLLIEHDMGVVMDISHHVVVLDYGRKIADGCAEQVRQDPRVLDAYLGVTYDQTPAAE